MLPIELFIKMLLQPPFPNAIAQLMPLLQTQLPNAAGQLMPLIVIALSLDALIVAVWYYLGVILNNPRVKGSALGEFYQFIGTVIMVGIIVGVLAMLSSVYYGAVSSTKLMSTTQIMTMCTNIETGSQLNLIGKTNSLLSGPTSGAGSFPGICSLDNPSATASLTNKLDYPLAASATIIANLTNQTVANLNYTFTVDAWLSFLSTLSPTIGVCFDTPPAALGCFPGGSDLTPPKFSLEAEFTPYAGYFLIINNLSAISSLLNISMESLIVQMLVISILIYVWPYLLFGGILLRSTLFTRRLGGLLMALALIGVFVFPAIYAFEYLALGNGIQTGTATGGTANPTGYNATYGFNAITSLPGAQTTMMGQSMPSNYVVNFFVEPNIRSIAIYNGCWPTSAGSSGGFPGITGLVSAEAADVIALLVPGVSLLSALKYLLDLSASTATPSFFIAIYCAPAGALNTFFGIMNAYGIVGIASWFIPLINIIITVSSVTGLSALFGGDTQLAGLSKIL